MITLHPEFIIDKKKQPKAVILPLEEWEKILEEIEELEDIRAFDEAKADDKDEIIPFEQAIKELKNSEL